MSLTKVSPSLFQVSNNITSVTVGGSANTISLTFDSNGVITGASNNAVSVANTAITGNIISTQITSVANTQITGNITAAQITSVANTQLTGLIQAAQIGSANATLITSGTLPKTRLPTGSVLQVVATNDSLQRSVNSGTYTASGMFVTITPTSATSNVLVQFSSNIYKNTDGTGYISIFRNGTNIAGSGNQFNLTSIFDKYLPCSILFLDSPASTSALTYEVYFARAGSANIYINATNSGVTMGSITVMEIAG